MKPPYPVLDTFTEAYLEAALWSSTDESDDRGGKPMDDNYGIFDLSEQAMRDAIADCKSFQQANAEYINEDTYIGPSRSSAEAMAGHNFWLTRNGHGCGFWDGDWEEEAGQRLTDAAHAFGKVYLYIGDDGEIYSTPERSHTQ